jgi:carotenoid 1,2-hydratase
VGSVFSPTYASARARGPADPLAFCALNVAFTGPAGGAWVMHEGLVADRRRDILRLGSSTLRATADGLEVELDVPRTRFGGGAGAALSGQVRLSPAFVDGAPVDLAPGQPWFPVAPRARASVALETPGGRFDGHGYHDANAGDAPLETAFDRWQWLRWPTADGAGVRYRGDLAGGGTFETALAWDAAGRRTVLPASGWRPVRRAFWRVPRDLPGDLGAGPRVQTLLDAPFYTRSLVHSAVGAPALHESVDLTRFRRPWVRGLLGWRTRTEPTPRGPLPLSLEDAR